MGVSVTPSLSIFLTMAVVLVANFSFHSTYHHHHSYTFIYSNIEPRDHDYLSIMSSFSTPVMHYLLLTTRAKWERTGLSRV